MQVSVIAQDKLGKPVSGLRREDFHIFDNNVPQQVRLFVAETTAPSPAPPVAPNTFLNQIGSTSGGRSGYSVILFDNLVTGFGDPFSEEGTGYGVRRVLRMLKSIPAFDKVAVYAFGRRLQVIHEFTSDRESIERQLQTWKPSVDDAVIGTDLCGGVHFAPPAF